MSGYSSSAVGELGLCGEITVASMVMMGVGSAWNTIKLIEVIQLEFDDSRSILLGVT